LVKRIQERIKEDKDNQEVKKQKLIVEAENCEPEPAILPSALKTTNTTSSSHNLQPTSASSPPKAENQNSNLKPKNQKPKTLLEISLNRPDRIIFMGEKIEVTATEFSLIHLLAQNRGKILTHNDLLDTIWKESEDATYVQITYHLYKIRRDILKIIGNNKKNKERVKDIFKVISRRGIMLNLEEDKLKIN
ncbi:helix-turn-helix domain-containing protein, partial [bacterium]|nr:helix-turn-helix domain-containing protein [bacterium]